jgi:hypothetical protein
MAWPSYRVSWKSITVYSIEIWIGMGTRRENLVALQQGSEVWTLKIKQNVPDQDLKRHWYFGHSCDTILWVLPKGRGPLMWQTLGYIAQGDLGLDELGNCPSNPVPADNTGHVISNCRGRSFVKYREVIWRLCQGTASPLWVITASHAACPSTFSCMAVRLHKHRIVQFSGRHATWGSAGMSRPARNA